MQKKTILVKNSLEARGAALFVQSAAKFKSSIEVEMGMKTVSAKSIMGIISLGILEGSELTLVADGPDENQALTDLANLFE